ncbi:MAG TPA: SagB/ThcOx family dehydrogenase [Nitrososphaeraceae archaeon]|nr:SagB/ThcOx family dehydrogenase [Nitrososphaeraceae archaeon]
MTYYKRSPFLFTSWADDDKTIVFNYNTHDKVLVSKDIVNILDVLSDWKNIDIISNIVDVNKKKITKVLEQLASLNIITRNTDKEDADTIGKRWNELDLAMQRQRNYGGRLPMSRRIGKSPSPVKRVKGISSYKLPVPKNTRSDGSALLDVLKKRKSIRVYSNKHITIDELSRFLFDCARIKKVFRSEEGTLTSRPYPSGGARYPLEIYVSNNRVDRIQKGIHYYDPLGHSLVLLNKNNTYRRKFNKFILDVQHPIMNREPDVVFIITAIFARTMWKYDRIGMSLILSDLGGLYQTMYLVATQMNLGPCPIGKINEDIIRDWLDLNWFEESHIGTFMLGVPEKD